MTEAATTDAGRMDAVRAAHANAILRGLGAPDPAMMSEANQAGLFMLHFASAHHRLAVVLDVMRYYARQASLDPTDYPALVSAEAACRERSAHEIAEDAYRHAIALAPTLAEAHFALARLRQLQGKRDLALSGFATTLEHPVHALASPSAFLHANAHWERATLLEDFGRDAEALQSYRAALSGLASFGVHHVRVARFFRRIGLTAEAIAEFRKCMIYSHRYFPEFMLPPLSAAPAVGPTPVTPVYVTSTGDVVVFHEGQYLAVPAGLWQRSAGELTVIPADMAAASRRASNIAALEPAHAST
ncbi:tetratricopeptide repeat protein [Bradyrhizobium sp.]|uniref:tetratricopeptide repeat protein n=1 Tax=Bradyrhizobium sp. TaxID=376 RepID=UPI001ECA253E|nr:tetratricopeptide repeat protein [Bradyrhizobium sp.]MBV9984803.1 tetratricopeptide repeat protein [Bradyrhizobium sp.]